MLRFYTHVRTHEGDVRDPEGAYALPLAGARADVTQGVCDLLSESMKRGAMGLRGKVARDQ